MAQAAMSSWCRWPLVIGALTLLVSCAGSVGWSVPDADAPLFVNKSLSAEQAISGLIPGQTTQADVLAALGPATVIRFDSGYEVWAYRSRQGRTRDEKRDRHPEVVMLFSPIGVLEKSRVRPATP